MNELGTLFDLLRSAERASSSALTPQNVIEFEPVVAAARQHLGDGRRPAVALARALAEHMGTDSGTIGVRVAIDCAEQLGIDLRVLLVDDDVTGDDSQLALLIQDGPGAWSGLIPDYCGIAWVPMPANALLDMDAQLLCPHDAAAALSD